MYFAVLTVHIHIIHSFYVDGHVNEFKFILCLVYVLYVDYAEIECNARTPVYFKYNFNLHIVQYIQYIYNAYYKAVIIDHT